MISKVLILTCSFAILIGCSNKNSRLGAPEFMPSNWLTIKSNSWQVRELPEQYRVELTQLRVKLEQERRGQYFNFHGAYTPQVQHELDTAILRFNQAYLDLKYSTAGILASLTPELEGLSQTHSERDADTAVTNNANQRMIHDDWNRILILDKASSLSPFPVIND